MQLKHNTFSRILTVSLGLVIALVSLVELQAPASPVAAQEPDEPGLSLQLIPVTSGLATAATSTPPVFNVGDTFTVAVVALGIGEPGLFGGQFEITFETEFLQAMEGSLIPGSEMEPVVNPVNRIDPGLVSYAASRQGDVGNLAGDVVLARLSFEALAPTEPPEGQTTTIHLQNVKLGARGGIEVPVAGLVDLDVIIRDDTVPNPGDIIGNVKVEGRADDNQAGHQVVAVGESSGVFMDTTDLNGDFWLNNAPADTYDLVVHSPGFLAAVCTAVLHQDDMLTELTGTTLLAGDINDDHKIDVTDAVAIGTALGSTDPGEVADLNADIVVNVLDLILMAVNYDQTTDGNPWACQSPPVQL